jgi:hypothetical protein
MLNVKIAIELATPKPNVGPREAEMKAEGQSVRRKRMALKRVSW